MFSLLETIKKCFLLISTFSLKQPLKKTEYFREKLKAPYSSQRVFLYSSKKVTFMKT